MNTLVLEHAGRTAIAKLDGARLTRGARRQFTAQLREYLAPGHSLIVDCSSWITLDSEALILIMEAVRQAREQEAFVWITGLQPGPAAIAEMVRLGELAQMHASVEEALRAIEQQTAIGNPAWVESRTHRAQNSRAMAAGA